MPESFPPGRLAGLLAIALAARATLAPAAPLAATRDAGGAAHGLDLAAMDPKVPPGDDFYDYANGNWMRHTQIPADRPGYGVFDIVRERTDAQVAKLLRESAQGSAPPDSAAQLLGDYYASFMDEAGIERLGLAPVQDELARIERIGDAQALAHYLGSTLRADVDVLNNTRFHTPNLFGLWVAKSLSGPARNLPFLLQGGLEMPDRDYYLDASARMDATRSAYREHIARVLALAHSPDAPAAAARIFELEHRIAQGHWSRLASEDVRKGDNLWHRGEFARRAPGLDWDAYFEGAGLAAQDEFVVWQPSAISAIAALVAAVPLSTWKEYLRFHALEKAAPFLPRAFVAEDFAFYGKVLAGTPQLRERGKRAIDATNAALGPLLGRLYVERYFPPSEKARAEAMVGNLITAFGARIDRLEWMDPATRARAKEKLATLRVGVGYPDSWRSYTGLRLVRGEALANAERAELFEYRYRLEQLHRPVDRAEWAMTPQTVNAVNLPALNALNFPAAILQPPFFDPARPTVMDYGAMGAVIGHEISHSFDDQGALFDAQGQLHDWWTAEDFAHFKAASTALARQFSQYRPLPDLAVNGEQTLSENIADIAGLADAYDAYHLALRGAPAPAWNGFSGDQQFFLAFAQNWRQKLREPALRQRIITDGHAPSQYRADTVRNLDTWYAAFPVHPGERLYLAPQARVRIW